MPHSCPLPLYCTRPHWLTGEILKYCNIAIPKYCNILIPKFCNTSKSQTLCMSAFVFLGVSMCLQCCSIIILQYCNISPRQYCRAAERYLCVDLAGLLVFIRCYWPTSLSSSRLHFATIVFFVQHLHHRHHHNHHHGCIDNLKVSKSKSCMDL